MKTYIDERPLEEIIQSVILDEKHNDFVEEVMDVLTRYNENYKNKGNPYDGDHTLYDGDIARLENRKATLEKQKETLEKMYNASFDKVVALETSGVSGPQEDEDEEEVDVDEEYYNATIRKKGGTAPIQVKPAEAAKRKVQQANAAKNFKTTMATTQQEILEVNKELAVLSEELVKYVYYQEVAVKTIRTLRRIINHYKIHRDAEFVRKGAYFVKDYSSKLIDRYNKYAKVQ
jgi:hypothetical protein